MASSRSGKTLSTGYPQRTPNEGLGVGRAAKQLTLSVVGEQSISGHIDALYRAFQQAVEEFGGTVALAASMEKPHPGISLKVRHALDSKHEIQKATLDMAGHVIADPKARRVFLFALCDEWGYRHPDARQDPTTEEKLTSLLRVLTGKVGDQVLESAASDGGFDVEAFKR